ncbi:MAG: inorganic phosphate transporter [Candidatus Thiodiazotropha sp.]|nr:inorganic phosphate transporter [Candidatus Thiodiazotropha taylori]MBT3058388.1 inorganic phosphate transporter [Candidatus Thiodiazotropha sp. (ex Lucina pensylvanica)]MBV2094168.1 inorganic phosphate transporter [Candidatus Thiodiazotropha sp. (ex Codakia orbicularis)]PUB72715.1 MAG: inorganic phosphate transporter [gamma proteobacterium symbiont of Ctena orbiculata]MBT3063895.1 inorganic phosphate transporter [Candidatus Thiodiazotropha sp. (ex Lucina pensylvanica)]
MSKTENSAVTAANHLLALLFLGAVGIIYHYLYSSLDNSLLMIAAAVLGGYLALNIGANDAGNNIGPLVGSAVIGLTAAMLFAAVFEAAGAYLAGGEVISTIKKGIVDTDRFSDAETITRAMFSAMIATAIWLNLATLTGTPVSTTHTIVGGVVGAGIAVGGVDVVNWDTLATITVSWFFSPVISGIIAALLLYLVKRTITYQEDMSRAAGRVLPLLVGFMAWSFSTYLMIKGVKASWRVDTLTALICSFAIGLGVYMVTKPSIVQRTALLPNTKSAVNRLFNIPLLFGAGLLSFAHGSNDVANAIGPVIAIKEAMTATAQTSPAHISHWGLLIGAVGIPMGLVLYGRRLIKTIGSEITELDQVRAFCIVTSVTITVLLASQFGLPVSSTHTAVGAVFGIGFMREILKTNYAILLETLRRHHQHHDQEQVEAFITQFDNATFNDKGRLLAELDRSDSRLKLSKKERGSLQKLYSYEFVKRTTFLRILMAWVVTLPVSAVLASLIFVLLD